MTFSPYLVMLHAVEIDDDNDTIIIDEAGVDRTATLTHGVFYARGDGDATDLLNNIVTALGAADPGGNLYAMALTTLDINPANKATVLTLSRDSGTLAFRVKWGDVATTFDGELLGFIATKGAADANPEVSTRTASCVWVCNDLIRVVTPRLIAAGAEEVEGADGSVDVVARSALSERRRIDLRLVDGRRLWAHVNDTDQAATLAHFWDVARDGRPLELHTVELVSGTTLGGLYVDETAMNRDGDWTKVWWVFCQPTIAGIEPSPVLDGMDSWDLELHVAGYVEP